MNAYERCDFKQNRNVAHSMLEQYPMVEKPVEQMTEEEIIHANMNNLLEFNKNLLDGNMLLEGGKGVLGFKDIVVKGGESLELYSCIVWKKWW